jgi:hypothetical protein
MAKAWRFCPHDEALVKQLCRDLRVSPLTAQVLVARELHPNLAGVRLTVLAQFPPNNTLPSELSACDNGFAIRPFSAGGLLPWPVFRSVDCFCFRLLP